MLRAGKRIPERGSIEAVVREKLEDVRERRAVLP